MKKPNIPPGVLEKLKKVAALQETGPKSRHTPERLIKDESTNRIKPAYVFREEGPPYEETLLLQQSNPDQQPPPTLESDVLHQVERVVGPATACLVVTYPGMGSVMCASAFLVADNPPTFATVRHAFAPVEINKHMRSYKDMFITTRVNASYSRYTAFLKDPKAEGATFIPVRVVAGQEEIHNKFMQANFVLDSDPCTGITLVSNYQYDIAFVEAINVPSSLRMHSFDTVLYPSAILTQDTVFVIGYPATPTEEDLEDYRVTFSQLTLNDLLAAFIFDHKNFSMGAIEYTDLDHPYIATHTCSTLRGHSGGPVYLPSVLNSFVGIHLGGMKDIVSFSQVLGDESSDSENNNALSDSYGFNYNFFATTLHPLFIELYTKLIVPRFGGNIPPLVVEYLSAIGKH